MMKTVTTIALCLSAFVLSSGNMVAGADKDDSEVAVQTPEEKKEAARLKKPQPTSLSGKRILRRPSP